MKKLKYFFTILLTAAILLSACGKELAYSDKNKEAYKNSVTILNTGQANCTLIESDGSFRIIDRGEGGAAVDIRAYLAERGVEKIDVFVLSHFHYDHTGNALDILRNFDIGTVVIPALSPENTPDSYFYNSLQEDSKNGYYNLEYAAKDKTYTVGSGEIKILADTLNDDNINNTSIALSYTHGDFVYVNLSDLESDGEPAVMDSLPENITLYSAAHHGASDANSRQLLEKLSPELCVVSRGRDNDYGHPHKAFLNRLSDLNIPCLITYEKGNIVYDISAKTYFCR